MGIYKLVCIRRIGETWTPVVAIGSVTNFRDEVTRIVGKWIDMVKLNGIWEHYNPDTGIGYGAEGLGMSCLIVDWMARLGMVTITQTSS